MATAIPRADSRNQLLRAMSQIDYDLLAPHLTLHSLTRGQVLFERDAPIDTIWFPESGVGSIILTSPAGLTAESGLFGRDGFGPVSVALGADTSPYKAVAQVGGECHAIPTAPFRRVMAASVSLRDLLLRYTHVLQIQMAYTTLSNAVHQIDERLGRWLLMTHDRTDGSELPLTHEYLSIMLGVRRPSVTTALHVLEGHGFIRSERGCIIIRDRASLEHFAEDSYGAPEAEYERLMGPLR